MRVEHRVSKQCTVQISGTTKIHWVQLVAVMEWFLQSKYKEQVYPFILGIVLVRSWRSEVSH